MSEGTEKEYISILIDFNKSVVGVVALLLGFSVTFITSEGAQYILLYAIISWIGLIFCVIFSLLSVALLVNVSRGVGGHKSAVLFSNISFFLLLFSLFAFALLGYQRANYKKTGSTADSISCKSLDKVGQKIAGRDCILTVGAK